MREVDKNSYICYNWMPMYCDHALDCDVSFYDSVGVSRLHNHHLFAPKDVREGDYVFVKTDYIYNGHFQNCILPHIRNNFFLVSGISSYHVGSNGDCSFLRIIENSKVIKWFCTNPPLHDSSKIVPLPIGFEERERPGGDQGLISYFRENKTSFAKKKDKVLLPYHTANTNPKRSILLRELSKLYFVEAQRNKLSWDEYMANVNNYKYVICLEGSGPDVHRNYECLLVNSVPVSIEKTTKRLFSYHGLPGVFLKDWSKLDIKNLVNQAYDFKNVSRFLKIKHHYDLLRGEV